MKQQVETLTCLAEFAGYLINGDPQGLSEEEIRLADEFLDNHPKAKAGNISLLGEEAQYGLCELTGQFGSVHDFTYVV